MRRPALAARSLRRLNNAVQLYQRRVRLQIGARRESVPASVRNTSCRLQETTKIMFRSVLREARTWSGYWRRRVALSWALRDKSDLAFPAMVLVPFLVLGTIVYFAYSTRGNFD